MYGVKKMICIYNSKRIGVWNGGRVWNSCNQYNNMSKQYKDRIDITIAGFTTSNYNRYIYCKQVIFGCVGIHFSVFGGKPLPLNLYELE